MIANAFTTAELSFIETWMTRFLPDCNIRIEPSLSTYADFYTQTIYLLPTDNVDCFEYAFLHELRHFIQFKKGFIVAEGVDKLRDNNINWKYGSTIIKDMAVRGWHNNYHLLPWERDANAFAYHYTGYVYDKEYIETAMLYFPLESKV